MAADPQSVATAADPRLRGLSGAEAAERLARHGRNVLPAAPRRSLLRRVGASLLEPLVLVLLAAATLTLVTADYADAAVIGLVLVVNTGLSVRQEVGADRALPPCSPSPPRPASSAATVTPGDPHRGGRARRRVELAEGDLVPADAVLLEAAALRVDESSLTGESVPVDKRACPRCAGRRRSRVEPADAEPPERSASCCRGRRYCTAAGSRSSRDRRGERRGPDRRDAAPEPHPHATAAQDGAAVAAARGGGGAAPPSCCSPAGHAAPTSS